MSKEAKDKAEELIEKMSFETHKYNAIHCALTCVDEILKTFDVTTPTQIEFWQQVKQEIINRQ